MGNFQDLRVWQAGLDLTEEIYAITKKQAFSNDFGLRNQIQRAAVSVPSNIAEGEDRGTDKEAIRFLNIAKGSAAEVITQLYIAKKVGYINAEELSHLVNKTERIRASLKKLIQAKGRK